MPLIKQLHVCETFIFVIQMYTILVYLLQFHGN